jgi:hypothetical protein
MWYIGEKQNILVYTVRQKFGINSLKLNKFFSKNSLDRSILVYKIHVLVPKKIPSSHYLT